jgi:hypothetical protein
MIFTSDPDRVLASAALFQPAVHIQYIFLSITEGLKIILHSVGIIVGPQVLR